MENKDLANSIFSQIEIKLIEGAARIKKQQKKASLIEEIERVSLKANIKQYKKIQLLEKELEFSKINISDIEFNNRLSYFEKLNNEIFMAYKNYYSSLRQNYSKHLKRNLMFFSKLLKINKSIIKDYIISNEKFINTAYTFGDETFKAVLIRLIQIGILINLKDRNIDKKDFYQSIFIIQDLVDINEEYTKGQNIIKVNQKNDLLINFLILNKEILGFKKYSIPSSFYSLKDCKKNEKCNIGQRKILSNYNFNKDIHEIILDILVIDGI
jgi:hypothetical protein